MDGPIILYLREVAARRALSAAYRRDFEAWQAYQAGERAAVLADWLDAPRGAVYCDKTQHLCTEAWRNLRAVCDAREAILTSLWEG